MRKTGTVVVFVEFFGHAIQYIYGSRLTLSAKADGYGTRDLQVTASKDIVNLPKTKQLMSFTHLKPDGQPTMVDVAEKPITKRTAIAETRMSLDTDIIAQIEDNDLTTKKGSVFQTAILAGIMAAKKTSELIPLCHPLPLTKVDIDIQLNEDQKVIIRCTAKVTGKTGVEMEALTGASVAALTVYDMCKGISQNMCIEQTRLIEKTGGKSDIKL